MLIVDSTFPIHHPFGFQWLIADSPPTPAYHCSSLHSALTLVKADL